MSQKSSDQRVAEHCPCFCAGQETLDRSHSVFTPFGGGHRKLPDRTTYLCNCIFDIFSKFFAYFLWFNEVSAVNAIFTRFLSVVLSPSAKHDMAMLC